MGVGEPSVCRSKAATVWNPAVLSLAWTWPTTSEAANAAGHVPPGLSANEPMVTPMRAGT